MTKSIQSFVTHVTHWSLGTAIITFALIGLFTLGSAFGGGRGDFTRDANSTFRETYIKMSSIEVRGSVTCLMGAENDGQGCNLRITDQNTGRAFSLSNGTDVRRMYNSGARMFAIQGEMEDSETIRVDAASAI
ncbi:MAG: hypothetical protein AB7P04_04965 [Bacteriovoracia bacterium]